MGSSALETVRYVGRTKLNLPLLMAKAPQELLFQKEHMGLSVTILSKKIYSTEKARKCQVQAGTPGDKTGPRFTTDKHPVRVRGRPCKHEQAGKQSI